RRREPLVAGGASGYLAAPFPGLLHHNSIVVSEGSGARRGARRIALACGTAHGGGASWSSFAWSPGLSPLPATCGRSSARERHSRIAPTFPRVRGNSVVHDERVWRALRGNTVCTRDIMPLTHPRCFWGGVSVLVFVWVWPLSAL